jgi:flagellar biogenesis protein FliO
MEVMVVSKVILSLIFIVILMYCVLKTIQKYSKFGHKLGPSSNGMQVAAILYIDENAKVVNLRQAKMNYILAIGKNNIVLIDKYADIERSQLEERKV